MLGFGIASFRKLDSNREIHQTHEHELNKSCELSWIRDDNGFSVNLSLTPFHSGFMGSENSHFQIVGFGIENVSNGYFEI